MRKTTDPVAIGHPAVLFGSRLKEARKAQRWTQGQLADRAGTTAGYLTFIEKGQANPTLDMLVKLADAVGLELWAMLKPPGR